MAYASYPDTLVTASATAHTKGVYAQIVASTPFASSRIYVQARWASLGSRTFLFDIATGASGSEVVLISNILMYPDFESLASGGIIAFDVNIPIGTRLSVRCQNSTTVNPNIHIAVMLEDRALASIPNPVTYGANTGITHGTSVDPGIATNTKGVYIQITPSTTDNISALAIYSTLQNVGDIISSFTTWKLDIAIGASGSEVIVIPDIPLTANSQADSVRISAVRYPIIIPAGTRIAVRCECSSNSATFRALSVILIGMQEPVPAILTSREAIQFSVVKPE